MAPRQAVRCVNISPTALRRRAAVRDSSPVGLGEAPQRPDDLRRADDAQLGIPHDAHDRAMDEIIASSLIRQPLGKYDIERSSGNLLVYALAALGLLPILYFVFFPAALAVGIVRVRRGRSKAWRGVVAAVVVGVLGLIRLVLANA